MGPDRLVLNASSWGTHVTSIFVSKMPKHTQLLHTCNQMLGGGMRRQKQEDQELKVCTVHTAGLRTAWGYTNKAASGKKGGRGKTEKQ